MVIDEVGQAGSGTAVLRGEIDSTRIADIRRAVRAVEGTADHLVLDLRGVTLLDSSGINLVFDTALRARRRGRRVTLLVTNPLIRRVLRMMFVEEVADVRPPFDVEDDREGPTVLPL